MVFLSVAQTGSDVRWYFLTSPHHPHPHPFFPLPLEIHFKKSSRLPSNCFQVKDGEDYKLDRNAELRFEVDARNEVQMEVCIVNMHNSWVFFFKYMYICMLALHALTCVTV